MVHLPRRTHNPLGQETKKPTGATFLYGRAGRRALWWQVMLRFRLGRIPVEVHFSHLFMAALLTWSFFPRAAGGWEGHSAAFTPSDLVYLALGTAVVFGSVLIHELGHALVSLGFGYRPSIQLVWMGGNTQPNAGGPIP